MTPISIDRTGPPGNGLPGASLPDGR